ncbi:MAG: hypothetical protein FWG85_07535, partial [Bacteroidetes bacterium]|nr:hypothetical protein [Bacteroidota bacterium]
MNNYYLNVFRKVLTMASHRAMMPSRQGVHKTKNATKDFFINNNSAKSFRKVLTMASHRAMMPSRQGVQKTKNATKDFLINNNSVKSFKKVFMLASCIAMMLAIFTPQTVAQDYLYAGPVDGSGNPIVNSAAPYYSAQNQNYYMFIGYDLAGSSSHAATLYILRNADMTNAEAGALLSASLWTSTPYNAGGGNDMNVQNMSLLLRNLPISDLPTQHLNTTVCPTSGITGINCYINAGWTLVKSDFTLSVLNNKTSFSWSDFIFDAPFEYDGVSNLGVLWIRNDASSVNSAGINYIGYNNTATSPFNNWYVKYGVGNWTSTNTSGSAIPISRFLIESEDHPNIQNYYKGAKVSLPGITTSQPAKKNVPVLNLSITTAGDMPPTQRLNQITFVEKNALTNLDAAKLYFSGTSSTFDLNT